ncbi:MAG: fibronectin type III domain-containing protein, partial [Acidimicrobiia bacterium]|nr:fibronectin type III domain-containing protein [Acidimicrobiia bacterium]
MVAVPQAGATHKLATPTNVQATPGNAQVSLSADAVTNANQYRWQYGTHPSGTTTTAARSRTTTIGSLTNNQIYRVRVSARAVSGGVLTHQDSDWSDWVTFTPHVPLNAPTDLSVSAGSAALSLSWTASTSTGVTGYDVHYTSAAASSVTNNAAVTTGAASAGWVAVTRTGTTASQAIPSLSNGTPYRVRVRAKSSTGLSGWVFGSGTPTAASVTLTGPATVVEGQTVTLTVTASQAVSSTAAAEDRVYSLSVSLGSAESADLGDVVG